MKTEDAIVGVIVLIFAVILLGDAILASYTDDMLLSANDTKGIAGMVFVVLAAFILWKAKEE